MNRHSSIADVTGKANPGGGGLHIARRWLCGCTVQYGAKTGSKARPIFLQNCPQCVAKKGQR